MTSDPFLWSAILVLSVDVVPPVWHLSLFSDAFRGVNLSCCYLPDYQVETFSDRQITLTEMRIIYLFSFIEIYTGFTLLKSESFLVGFLLLRVQSAYCS